jgi:hypothetical protein
LIGSLILDIFLFVRILELQRDLDTTLRSWRATLLQGGKQVGNIVPGMPVETSAQPLLIQEVGNETDTSAEHEETIKHTHLEVVFSLLRGESAAVAHQVHKADSNAAVDVENEVVLFGRGDRLNRKSVVEHLEAREILVDVLLDELDTKIGVVSGLDPVTNAGD